MSRPVTLAFLVVTACAAAAHGGHSILVSKGPNGQANGECVVAGISADGSRVLFLTTANNLAPTDLEFKQDAFVYDRGTDTIAHASVDDPAHPMPTNSYVAEAVISGDGGTVFFVSAGMSSLFAHDLATATTQRIVDGGASNLAFGLGGCSFDGTRVVFTTTLTGLDPADPTTDQDVYVYDTVTSSASLVNKNAAGQTLFGPAYIAEISGNGRYVTFLSPGAYVPGDQPGDDLFRKDLLTGAVVRVHPPRVTAVSAIIGSALSHDGSRVLLSSDESTWAAGDTNGVSDIFLWDEATNSVELVSRNASGQVGNAFSASARMSGDANWITWTTSATNLVPADPVHLPRAILKDRAGNRLHSCSAANSGVAPNGGAASVPWVSDDGTAVAFSSSASNLVIGDGTAAADAFVHRVRSFHDLGYGVAGVTGIPQLVGTGTLDVGDPLGVALSQAAPNAPMLFCVALAETPVFTFGGTFVALPIAVSFVVATDAGGNFGFTVPTPGPQLPNLYIQCLIADPSAAEGVSMSNAIVGAAF